MKKQFYAKYFSLIFFVGLLVVSCNKENNNVSLAEASTELEETRMDKSKINLIKKRYHQRAYQQKPVAR